jgi:hypothetical protein
MLFLLFIGTLIERQPLYIKGIKPRVQLTNTQSSQSAQKSQQRRYQGGVPTWEEEPHHLADNQLWDAEELLQLQRQREKRRRLQALRASSQRKTTTTTTTTTTQQQPKYSSSSSNNSNNNNGYNSQGQWRMMTESSNA